MKHECYGLAYNESKLFASDYTNTLYIHDMNGRELRSISTDTSSNALFKMPSHITLSAGGDRVFVAIQEENIGVVILDIQGNFLSNTADPTMSGFHGLCTDGSNLFVCGLFSHNIVQIGQNNILLGEVAKVQSPLSLCFDHQNSRMIVTQHLNNSVTVLDLE
jgi:DNA-binding beta-propeller fold protein YncE